MVGGISLIWAIPIQMTHIQSTIDTGRLLRSSPDPRRCRHRRFRRPTDLGDVKNLISPAVLRVFTAILALSAVVILACAQDPAPSPTPAPTASLEPTAATPTTTPQPTAALAPTPTTASPQPTAKAIASAASATGGHEADDGFGSDYHAQQGRPGSIPVCDFRRRAGLPHPEI